MSGIHFTASETCRLLGISHKTLYAYVSRGLIRSEPGDKPRTRRYAAADVEALQQRQELRRSPQNAIGKSLDWGTPILDSSLTLIADGRLFYRGEDAIKLAFTKDFQSVAGFFWTGRWDCILPKTSVPKPGKLALPNNPLTAFQSLLPRLAESDAAAVIEPAAQLRTGVRLIQFLASIITGEKIDSLAEIPFALAETWGIKKQRNRRLLEAALILCLDHELNISSFTSRCVASAGSGLYDAVNAAISAFMGFRHGGGTRRVERLFDDLREETSLKITLNTRLRHGEFIPGFGHRLYPGGDPRAIFLLGALREQYPENSTTQFASRLAQSVEELIQRQPNLDFALVVLRRVLKLPPDAALLLFALGRTAGWIGHTLEQTQAANLIRPRARYTGPAPQPLFEKI